MTDNNQTHNVVVIGGGYAGTLAANRLQQNTAIDITLVNRRPKFVQRLRLHQFVAGTGDATADYGTLIGDGVQLVVDSATRIDATDTGLWRSIGAFIRRAGAASCRQVARQKRGRSARDGRGRRGAV